MTEVADEQRQQEEGVRDRAASTLQEAASTTQEKAAELRSRGADQLRQQLDTRTTDVGRQARSVGQALGKSGESLQSEGNAQAAAVTRGAAERMERFGDYLERVDGDQLLRDAERFARQRPWLLAGLGLFAGLAASRMLKASSQQRYQSSQPTIRPYVSPAASSAEAEPATVREPVFVPDTTGRELGDAGRGL
jgi:ElaB/YqjD/DUF883 family membrane-anchored ribosome-binding protein